jgi:hypothetical protein
MAGLHTLTEGIALRLLARDGIAAIWHLQMAAAAVYRAGDPIGADSILEIAAAAEREWMRREIQPLTNT